MPETAVSSHLPVEGADANEFGWHRGSGRKSTGKRCNVVKCPNCGANIHRHDRVCPYCGAENPTFQSPVEEVPALLEKGMKAYREEQYAQAIDCYRRAIAIDPNLFEAYFYLADSWNMLGRQEEAIKAMETARAIRPGNTSVCYNLGVLYKRIGRKAEARAYLEKALGMVESDVSLSNRERMKQAIQEELSGLRRRKLF